MSRLPPLTEAEHLDKARHDEALLDVLITDVVPNHHATFDWALVIMFYAALHYASAALLRDTGSCPEQHGTQRRKGGELIQGMADAVSENYGTTVAPAYHALYNQGYDARYRGLYLTQTNVKDALDTIHRLRPKLDTVKSAKSIKDL
jgi:hypothetical protein